MVIKATKANNPGCAYCEHCIEGHSATMGTHLYCNHPSRREATFDYRYGKKESIKLAIIFNEHGECRLFEQRK